MATILPVLLVSIFFFHQCGENISRRSRLEIDPYRFCARADASCGNRAPGRRGRVPDLPPWRLSGGLWHVGVTTAAMLKDLMAEQGEVYDDPPMLAVQFLTLLDRGEFRASDLGALCASILWPMPVYWRDVPSWTWKPDGSRQVMFANAPDIPDLLHYTLRILSSQWYEVPQRKEKMLETFSMVAGFTYSFLRIHPLLDGNGRCSRFMAGWMLYRELGFKVELPDANETTRYTMAEVAVSRYVMLHTLNHPDASLLAAFLIDCAWSHLQEE